jgi:hypothetical protein
MHAALVLVSSPHTVLLRATPGSHGEGLGVPQLRGSCILVQRAPFLDGIGLSFSLSHPWPSSYAALQPPL